MNKDIKLYKELVVFCNDNGEKIEEKFERKVKFDDFKERFFEEMYLNKKTLLSDISIEPVFNKYLNDRKKIIATYKPKITKPI